MPKNYYGILGIGADASEEEIRSAYRRKAKELHPDRSGDDGRAFRALQEAYETLSDPPRRRAYDACSPGARRLRPSIARAEPLRSWHAPVEPLIPTDPWDASPVSPMGRSYGTPFADLFERLWDGLYARPASPGDRKTRLAVDVHLSPAEAQRGGQVTLSMTVQESCPTCYGYGHIGTRRCMQCDGYGTMAHERPLALSYPANIQDGDVGQLPLDRFGMPGARLTVRFWVR